MGLSILLFVHFGQVLFNLGFERRQVLFDDVPKFIFVNLVVIMDKDISHSYYSSPICGRVGLKKLLRESVRGFANNLHVPSQRMTQNLVGHNVIKRFSHRIFLNSEYRILICSNLVLSLSGLLINQYFISVCSFNSKW